MKVDNGAFDNEALILLLGAYDVEIWKIYESLKISYLFALSWSFAAFSIIMSCSDYEFEPKHWILKYNYLRSLTRKIYRCYASVFSIILTTMSW